MLVEGINLAERAGLGSRGLGSQLQCSLENVGRRLLNGSKGNCAFSPPSFALGEWVFQSRMGVGGLVALHIPHHNSLPVIAKCEGNPDTLFSP